jgi:hypothetical protein
VNAPRIVVTAIVVCLLASPAFAQLPRKLPIAAFDIRGFYSKLGQDPITASDLEVTAADLPARGLGGVAGIHLYPLRFERMAIGIDAEGLLARGHSEIGSQDDEETLDNGSSVLTQPVDQRLRGLSVGISLNFGHADGWSYLTAGLGPTTFITYTGGTRPAEAPPVSTTLNFGGGARWFMKSHMAFCFDIRFYQTRPEVLTPSYPRRQRNKLLVMSAGVAFK